MFHATYQSSVNHFPQSVFRQSTHPYHNLHVERYSVRVSQPFITRLPCNSIYNLHLELFIYAHESNYLLSASAQQHTPDHGNILYAACYAVWVGI